MAKYNLMDVEKPEYFDRYFDEDEDKKETPKSNKPQIDEQSLPDIDEREYFDESLFTEEKTSTDEPSTPDALAEEPQEQKITEPPVEAKPQPQPQPEIKPEPPIKESPITTPRSDFSEYEYEDSKMQGINWKPLLIWTTVFIAIAAIVFFAYTWFFANGEETAVVEEQPTISPQEQLRIEQEQKKLAFIKNIVSDKKSKLSNFSSLSNLKTSGVTYASVLMYDNSFKFEVFGQSRDDIAKYNQNLKKNNYDDSYKIVSVDTRPGSNGGVFALYNVEKISGGTPSQVEPKIDTNIQSTIQNLIGKNSLKLINDRVVSRKSMDQFEMIRKEIQCRGSETNCVNLLNDIYSTNNNFSVHKISLIPTNQKNIKNSKYNLLIIFDFYV